MGLRQPVLRLTPDVPLRRGDHRSPHDREVDYFLHGNAALRSPQPMRRIRSTDSRSRPAKVFADPNDEAIRDDCRPRPVHERRVPSQHQ